jgi:hypothetical protein
MSHLATTVLNLLTATGDPRFAEDIAHLQKLIAEADANEQRVRNILTVSSTETNIAHLSKGPNHASNI